MKKYFFSYGEIKRVEIVKETPKTFTLKMSFGEGKYRRETTHRVIKGTPDARRLFDTWEGAKAYRIARIEQAIKLGREQLTQHEAELAAARVMEEPAE